MARDSNNIIEISSINSCVNNVDKKYTNIISIYPNPYNDNITVRNNFFSSNNHLEVYNIMGQIIFQCNFERSIEIDLSNNPRGIYFIKVKCGTDIYLSKIIKI